METFATWLAAQLADNRLTAPEFAELANMKLPTLWRILNEQRGVGKASAGKIAKALNLPEHLVMIRAGIASSNEVMPGVTTEECELLAEYRRLSEAERDAARSVIRVLREKRPYYQGDR